MRLLAAGPESAPKPSLIGPDLGMEASLQRLQRVHPLTIRYPRLERLCRPQSETFWVIGGRPGAFKTALVWNLALNMAEQKHRVLFVSLEMTPGELFHLALAKYAQIDRHRIAQALGPEQVAFTPTERRMWEGAIRHLFGLELTLRVHGADDLGRDIDDVLASACRARFDAVFVDHLGMIGRDSQGRELDVLSQAIHRLRGLSRGEVSKGYRPWVVATSQLNREIDKGDEERKPRLADFRGSARIEHDADVAIGLQKRKGAEEGKSILDAWVLKNRNGNCPELCMFDAHGPTGLITERRKQEDVAKHRQEGNE